MILLYFLPCVLCSTASRPSAAPTLLWFQTERQHPQQPPHIGHTASENLPRAIALPRGDTRFLGCHLFASTLSHLFHMYNHPTLQNAHAFSGVLQQHCKTLKNLRILNECFCHPYLSLLNECSCSTSREQGCTCYCSIALLSLLNVSPYFHCNAIQEGLQLIYLIHIRLKHCSQVSQLCLLGGSCILFKLIL